MNFESRPISSATWIASSRVGSRISAYGLEPAVFFSMTGTANDAVLPVPVCAWPMMSRPASAAGIVSSWMGVGSSNPMSAIALSRPALRFSSAKLFMSPAPLLARPAPGGPHRIFPMISPSLPISSP